MGQVVSSLLGISTISERVDVNSCQHPANYIMFLPPDVEVDSDNSVEYCTTGGRTVAYKRWVPNSYKNLSVARQKYILWSHGNAMDIFSIPFYFRDLSNALGIGICVYDYPGYGFSTGYPYESACYENHTAMVNELMHKFYIPKSNIFLVGQSIGTGVVVDFIYRNAWTTPAMLISPYKSIFSIVMQDGLMKSMLSIVDRFNSISKMPDINCPIKIVHGIEDNIINVSHGQALYQALKNKGLVPEWMPETSHNDILNNIPEEWFQELIDYQYQT